MVNYTMTDTKKGLSIHGVSMSKSTQEELLEERVGSFVGSEDASDMKQYPIIEQIADINQKLEKQVETLVLRLQFGDKHHVASQEALKLSMDSEIRAKDSQINALKTELKNKEISLSTLEDENDDNKAKMSQLQSQIDEMKLNMEYSISWMGEVQREIVNLESDNRLMVSGKAFEETEKEISAIKKELFTFQQNVKVMSKEINHAREIIVAQGNSIRILETEKLNTQTKFKEDLQRIQMSLRLEIERMRDIMQNQWTEMKQLREQNLRVRQDVKDIRNLLSVAHLDSSKIGSGQKGVTTYFPPSKNPTRGPPHPRLPTLSTKRSLFQQK